MGMFNYVRCEATLPGEATHLQHNAFQTKDFDRPRMGAYQITVDGRLLYFGHQAGSEPEDTEFHGMLNFYTFLDYEKEWWKFVAKFTDGRLVEIKRIDEPERERAG